MSKLLVETSGEFMLIDTAGNQEIPSNRPAVIRSTPFSNRFAGTGQLVIIVSDLPDEATDAEFAQYWEEAGDRELAIQSFTSAFEPEQEPEPEPEPKPKPKRRSTKKKAE
jgi:hypothetical protein